MNVATFAQSQAERFGSRVPAVVDEEPISYAELAERSARVAAGLVELGIGRGDRVAVMMSTRPELLYCAPMPSSCPRRSLTTARARSPTSPSWR